MTPADAKRFIKLWKEAGILPNEGSHAKLFRYRNRLAVSSPGQREFFGTYSAHPLFSAPPSVEWQGKWPCGYAGLKTVDLSTIGVQVTRDEVAEVLGRKLCAYLSP